MTRRNFIIYLLIVAVILSLLSFTSLTGCRRARLERLKKLKEALEASEEEVSQSNKVEDVVETSSEEGVELSEEAKESEAGKEAEESTSEIENEEGQEAQQEEESTEVEVSEEETEESEQEETTESQEETTEETTEETIQLTEEFVNLIMEGGSITKDFFVSPGIGCGDDAQNIESRGFASFDISGITGAKILDAKIKAIDGRKDGEPFKHYGPIIIKAVYWGPYKISPSNFDIDGVELANFTVRNFTIANKKLKDDLQNAVNHGLERYQICLYFEMENTDGNGIQDLIHHDPDKIILTVTYSMPAQ